jgi:hypothetical protein
VPESLRRTGVALVRFSQKPSVRLFVGATLLVTGLDDVLDALYGSDVFLNVGVFHGITVLGFQQVLHGVGSLLEGVHETGKHTVGDAEPSATASDSRSRQSA